MSDQPPPAAASRPDTEPVNAAAPPPAAEWVRAYANRLGVDAPSAEEIDTLLDLAGVAAHASERQAAPISTWLAARSGLSPQEALERARDLAAGLG